MSGAWKQVQDVRGFLAQRGTVKSMPHNLNVAVLHWRYCSRCGLIALKNDASRKAMKAACVVEE